MNCKLLGRDCIKTDCRQYARQFDSCNLERQIGYFLCGDWNAMLLLRFTKYLEEIRPSMFKSQPQ